MATHDYVIANGTGAAVRSDLNDALAAIVSNNSSSSEPATTYAYQWWADTTANVLKIRNSANNAWVTLRELDGTMLIEDGSAASPGLAFADDTNTGIFSSGADQLGLSTNGVERISVGTGSVILNNDGNDVDFRVESNGEDHMLFVDGGNNRVGIGCAAPVARFEVSDDTQTDITAGDLVVDTTGLSADVLIGRLSSRSNDNTSFRVRNRVDSTILSASSGTPLTVGHSSGEALRVDNSRRMIIGSSTLRTVNTHSSRFQVQGTDFSSQTASIIANSTDGNGGFLFFAKQRSGAAGGNTIVQSGDLVGQLRFNGCDGVDMETLCASIDVNIDGTPGANDMPGRITFHTTADGASATTERLRIDSAGDATFKGSSYVSFNDNGYIRTDSSGYLRLQMGSNGTMFTNSSNSELARIDTSGRLLIGTSAAREHLNDGSDSAQVFIQGTTQNTSTLAVIRSSDNDGPAHFVLGKARGTGQGSTTVVQSGDTIGHINFEGADGTHLIRAGQISCVVDSTPGANDMPGRLTFSTCGDGSNSLSERMRITSSGIVAVNRTAALHGAVFVLDYTNGSTAGLAIKDTQTSGTGVVLHVVNGSGTVVGGISQNQSTTSFNTSSDYRLKENVVDITDGITRVKQLQPRRFNFIANDTTTVDGFVAHEAQTVVPEAVTGTHNEVDEDDNPVYQGIDQSKLVPLLTAALQEAIAKIETLETKVAALEAS